MKLIKGISILSAAILLAACGGDGDTKIIENEIEVPVALAEFGLTGDDTRYAFPSKVLDDANTSSVATTGQITRHLLINELKNYIGSDEFQGLTLKAEALANLNFIYEKGTKDLDDKGNDDISDDEILNALTNVNVYTEAAESTPVNTSIKTEDATLEQSLFSDLSSDKNLKGKLAGQDNDLTHAEFVGWNVAGDLQERPNALIQTWFDQLATLATDGDVETTVVTAEGLDLQQLVQKFLLGGITYSQAGEDYLKAGKGLLKQNSEGDKANTKPYTTLEHQWDEGFGYFGAAQDYLAYTDVEMAGQADHDTDENGEIDFYSEYSFGNSINAVKRDKGATSPTYFSENAMMAFIQGRQIIQDNFGTNPADNAVFHAAITRQAELALNNWENSIAATVIHYINDVTADMNKFGSEDYSLSNHAKHWSEMKGFALGLQFSPVDVAQISLVDLKAVHAHFAEAPVLSTATAEDIAAYKTALLDARTILKTAYSFSAENVANW
ncbi:MAG: DUF4856 domain-containing protein [Oleispira sp.]|nr:DUF4856 domain-containing protein [Oleispira sp.]MBL4881962.1 DUF4856 domain-containing protein [Oleispira sp.]